MSEKLRFISTEVFFERPINGPGNVPVSQMTVLLPVEAISHLVQKDKGNPRSAYYAHFKTSYLANDMHKIKSINPVLLPAELIEVLK